MFCADVFLISSMFRRVLLLLGICSLACFLKTYSKDIENSVPAETSLLEVDTVDAGSRSHEVLPRDINSAAFSIELRKNESEYFVSALFYKYSRSENLSMDGFARLLCNFGLIPAFAETTREADDTFQFEDGRKKPDETLDCMKVTFQEVQTIFEKVKLKNMEHNHQDESHYHGDDHIDHDHQHNRNVGGAKSSSSQGPEREGAKHLGYDADLHNHDDGNHADHNHHDERFNEKHIETKIEHAGANSANQSSSQSHSIHNVKNNFNQHEGNLTKNIKSEVKSTSDLINNSISDGEQMNHDHSDHTKCTSPQELLQHFHILKDSLTISDFIYLCPALLYEIDSGVCLLSARHHHDLDSVAAEQMSFLSIPGKVWGFSIAAVTVISLAGLLGVAVIPIMQKVLYNHLLQFLVAVAVGALSGDALLHLLPHAIAKNLSHDHSSDNHHSHSSNHDSDTDHLDAVWKGLVALLCIFFFFLMERILTIVTERKRRKKSLDRLKKKRCEQLCDIENSTGIGAKLSANDQSDYSNCDQMVMVVHPNRALKGYADATHDVLLHQCDENLSQTEHSADGYQDNPHDVLGHSHGQGHVHSHCDMVPSSVAAVAWMVILGDGIHNFSDGLAIGAAFASSVTGGISTSIAVLCHELPHEIGDFAVLLRAGMSVKQAVVYNCVSSVLCFLGMLVGVAIGNIHNASLWIFSGVGGTFLYISLVDMLPEMTAVDTKQGENQFLHLILQVVGMMIGSGIMLVIAVYEHDLQDMIK